MTTGMDTESRIGRLEGLLEGHTAQLAQIQQDIRELRAGQRQILIVVIGAGAVLTAAIIGAAVTLAIALG